MSLGANVELSLQDVQRSFGVTIPLAAQGMEEVFRVSCHQVEHVPQGWDVSRGVEQVVLDQLLDPVLTEEGLVLGILPELVEVQDNLKVETQKMRSVS